MSETKSDNALPANYDSRVTTLLDQPLAEDVTLAFYYLNAGRSPHPNYRWELHRDGALFLVHHSGKNLQFDVTFDQPLPKSPTKTLSKAELAELDRKLEETKFFGQPGYQANTRAEDGDIVIVRARRGSDTNVVVYENLPSPIVDYLYTVAQ